jgi:peptide/nickel transport system permease protein
VALTVESAIPEAATGLAEQSAGRRGRLLGTLGRIMLGILVLMVLMVTFGPMFLKDPNVQVLRDARLPIGAPGHLFGTDGLGRDILSRAITGGRVSIAVGAGAVVIGLVVGGGLGLLAGYFKGRVEAVIMFVVDVLLAFPSLVLALTISAFLGPSIKNIVLAIGVITIPAYARLARASAVSWSERDFVLGSRLMGGGNLHVMVRHLIPNVIQPLFAYGLLVMAKAIITEAALSFLGLGLRAPQSSWGVMIAEGRSDMATHPAGVLVPGVLLFLTIVSLNLLGDTIRERLRGKGANL